MYWIKSGIENPSKSEIIGRRGGDEKTNDHAEQTKSLTLKHLKKSTYIYKQNSSLNKSKLKPEQ